MSRYIERDALSEVFTEFVRRANNHDFELTPTWNDAISIFHSMPTADVVEVVHGKWIELYENNYKCSACGDWWETIEGTPQDNGMSYCPHCGARMDGAV